jgi:hypothetical protein
MPFFFIASNLKWNICSIRRTVLQLTAPGEHPARHFLLDLC